MKSLRLVAMEECDRFRNEILKDGSSSSETERQQVQEELESVRYNDFRGIDDTQGDDHGVVETYAAPISTAGPQIPDPSLPDTDGEFSKPPPPRIQPIHLTTTTAIPAAGSIRRAAFDEDTDDGNSEKKVDTDPIDNDDIHRKSNFCTPNRRIEFHSNSLDKTTPGKSVIADEGSTSSPCTPPSFSKFQPLDLEKRSLLNDTTIEQQTDESFPSTNELRYYRIVYRGVVALLSDPLENNPLGDEVKKSGVYLSYGEIVASCSESLVENPTASIPSTPNRKLHPSPRLGSAVSTPVLSHVWEQQQQQEMSFLNPSSPPRSLASVTGSVSSLETTRTTSTVRNLHQPIHPNNTDTASIVTATTTTTTASTPPAPTQTKMRLLIRVDRVLTGGYAIDATEGTEVNDTLRHNVTDSTVKAHAMTPKRGNTHSHPIQGLKGSGSVVTGPTPVPISITPSTKTAPVAEAEKAPSTPTDIHQTLIIDIDRHSSNHGYLYSEQGNVPVAVPLTDVPQCQPGTFRYRVVSSTPVSILTGPCLDAPRTKAILLPGTIHEVCLKVITKPTELDGDSIDGGMTFLRLSRRRGWVTDRKTISSMRRYASSNTGSAISNDSRQTSWVVTMKEISEVEEEDCDKSVSSRVTTGTMTSAVATPISTTLARHRPPRRKRGTGRSAIDTLSLPRHVLGPSVSHGRNHQQHDTSALTDNSILLNSSSVSHSDARAIVSPSSNISLLSDESSSLEPVNKGYGGGPQTPDRSVARSVASANANFPTFFLMRVNAPRGLKILDAPHFQVNNLIHGNNSTMTGGSAGKTNLSYSPIRENFVHQHTTTIASKISNPAILDSVTKTRNLPRGALFEASKRIEASNAITQGSGLIKLSDNSGWAIVPRQQELDDQYRTYSGTMSHPREANRAFEEVGNATIGEHRSTLFLRVLSRNGINVSLPPVPTSDSEMETSPTSSATGSSALSGTNGPLQGQILSQDSDVASSVGSSFLDAMFRTPTKRNRESEQSESRRDSNTSFQNSVAPHTRPPPGERHVGSSLIPCGSCVEVERWSDPPDTDHSTWKNEFARLRGGQGWIPRFSNGKPVVETVSRPEFRFGSFWFRVQERRGLKVRLGPSHRAPSIKSDDGVYFRFECGEFLRASEIVTFFRRNSAVECFAKLYRNRHVRLHTGHNDIRPLASLTAQAEWVQVFGDGELYLEECAAEPRIERHRQGWRYNVVLDARISVRRGPSFASETVGVVLLGGESVLVNERVTGPDDSITWLRLMDGQGWVHNYGAKGESLMIPHSLRHRNKTIGGRSAKPGRDSEDQIAYNTIIARLFHNDVPGDRTPSRSSRGSNYRGTLSGR